ncbi:LOW QUALITY PROTEIN: EEF1A lysine methyltransferase 4-like, partial [Osmerus eperlanus]|uniref:LOW QUALITY PROTEIN: EEF1A lysine methyltransferase 4-like n=1 Tax=Osmerus eperlanus TaxID=29151 RepID=UPI002E16703D
VVGNSAMSVDMHRAGYHSICNIDYSSVAIDTMSTRHADCPGMSWLHMDARQLSFPDGSFDVVLEKGTLDAMLVEEKDPWEVSSDAACLIHRVLSE